MVGFTKKVLKGKVNSIPQGTENERFKFGKNWSGFLTLVDEDRIVEAEKSLKKMIEVENLKGRSFLDVGSGSGLFSLAAKRLGALVHSFDYDHQSVACTKELKRRFFQNDPEWTIEWGDVLDREYLKSLGQYDIVYSWGVLHHTGAMWQALENVASSVAPKGVLFISIYNYQGNWSTLNNYMKRFYVRSPVIGKGIIAGFYIIGQIIKGLIVDMALFQNPVRRYIEKKKSRGMSVWHDWIDWVGGYPFEVAKPEEVFDFYRGRGFTLLKLKTDGGYGCNEYVFQKIY